MNSKLSKITKSKMYIYVNCILLIGFVGLVIVLVTKKKDVEGIRNMNCCGGITPGVHYRETDTKPPVFVRRCFKSNEENGETVYQWDGFPCTSKESSQCCGGEGECIPSTRGGYCRGSGSSGVESRNFIFQRRSDTPSAFIKRGNDRILDVTDAVDMEDYYFAIEQDEEEQEMSPEMRQYMERRRVNEEYIQSHVVDRARDKLIEDNSKKNQLNDTKQKNQIKITLTMVHIIILVGFAIIIKDLVIQLIDNFYGSVGLRYAEFTGKTL